MDGSRSLRAVKSVMFDEISAEAEAHDFVIGISLANVPPKGSHGLRSLAPSRYWRARFTDAPTEAHLGRVSVRLLGTKVDAR